MFIFIAMEIEKLYTAMALLKYLCRKKRPAVETKLLQELGLLYTAVYLKIVHN